MSNIPSSAMPHATAEPENETEASPSRGAMLRDSARNVAEKAKANPKTSLAIGAGVIAATAATAAGAVALSRRGRSGANGKDKAKKS